MTGLTAQTSDFSNPVAPFIARRSSAEAAGRANYQRFLSELCDVLGVPRPIPRPTLPARR